MLLVRLTFPFDIEQIAFKIKRSGGKQNLLVKHEQGAKLLVCFRLRNPILDNV